MRATASIRAICAALLLPIAAAPRAEEKKADAPKTVEVGPNVVVEIGKDKKRRVIVTAEVCLRKGPLEGLLTRKGKKEHEYILAADLDARHLHAALEAAGAEAGSPVTFDPKFAPAKGATVKISLRYTKDKKTVTVSAGEWIRHRKTKKPLEKDWVFGGSRFVKDPEDPKKKFYVANYGDLVCVVNMDSAMLDLPERSSKTLAERVWEPNSDEIPAETTKVEVIFEPVSDDKKDEKKDK